MKKHSLFAKLLVMLLCVALVFCGCQQSGNNESSDGGKEEVVPKTPEAQLS